MNKYAQDLKLAYKEEKKKSVELKQKSHELERSNDDLENFAYVASHDLKAPLRAIDNLASWIAEDLVGIMNDETKDHIAILKTRVSRMDNLLNSLLAYSRVGRIESKVEKTDMNKLLRDIVAMINPPESVSIDILPGMPVFDTLKAPLQQVFMNLIGNAVKHRGKQNINIAVSFEDIGKFYRFMVKDDGPGIPEKLQSKAFQLFQTLKPRDEVEGSGMGLAIVKKTIESQGGTITINSSQGTGASFSFTWNKKIK